MKSKGGWIATLVIIAVAAAGFYYQQGQGLPAQQILQQSDTSSIPAPATQSEEVRHYPIPALPAAQEQLPPLKQSDTVMRNALTDMFGSKAPMNLFHPQGIVRRIVVTVDNLPRQMVAVRLLPTKPVGGRFITTGSSERGLFIAPENAARYTPYVQLAEMVDTKKLVAIYVKFYPLFQQAYQELGYPQGYFNNRLVATIDDLLAAPKIEGLIPVVQPHILYKFADPALESSSAGHKVMLRMGSENAERIKMKLQAIRRELSNGALAG